MGSLIGIVFLFLLFAVAVLLGVTLVMVGLARFFTWLFGDLGQ